MACMRRTKLHKPAPAHTSLCRDIGTSFIYVFPAVFTDAPTDEDVIGAVSLIVWTITTLCLVKYALLVLRADDNGQG